MNSDSLKKPIDLQGLSLALAKTKVDYMAQVGQLSEQIVRSNWEQENEYENDYIKNKPAIRAGDDEDSILIGQIEQDKDAKIYHLTFDYPTKTTDTVTFTTEDNLSKITWDSTRLARSVCNLLYTYSFGTTSFSGNIWRNVKNIDVTNNTITFDTTLSRTSGYSYTTVNATLYYYCKIANGGGGTVAEGMVTYSVGKSSHAEGRYTKALNNYSHAEGYQTTASGMYSHTEGSGTSASEYASHAEGFNTTTSGSYSHAEGSATTASGSYSHAEGSSTIASSNYQHVQGKYNIEDANSTYADIVGNGTSSARSNAYTLDWSGNGWFAGKVSAGTAAAPANPTAANDLATKAYVDSATSGITTNLAGLTDTTITSPSDGQVLTYDGTNQVWVNGESSGAYYVTITGSTSSASGIYYNTDKTFSEAYAAHSTGAIVKIKWNTSIFHLIHVSSGGMSFVCNESPYFGTLSWTTKPERLTYSSTSLTDYQTKLTFDSAPTENSANPVTSGGVYTALQSAGTTYSLSISGSTITLTGTDGTTSSVSLPVYDGSVTEVWQGGVY